MLSLLEKLLSKPKRNIIILIDLRDSYKQTPLLLAVESRYNLVVKLLFNKGANVNTQSKEDGNVLYAALDGGHE